MKVLESITKWKSDGVRVIGIEGYSGSGKTTLAHSVARQMDGVKVFSVDDFTPAVELEKFVVLEDPVAILDQYVENQGVAELLQQAELASAAAPIIIEGPFLLYEKSLVHMIEKLVYVDADFAVADVRRFGREGLFEPTEESRKFSDYFKKAYAFYLENYRVKEMADLVVGMDSFNKDGQ
ncbi:MAG: hypothetical protein COV10_00415 [Candidatus Vogelbacteria bacterium CG10_big_fil_rev_8_21_14_0_10_51_16]|uniref:Phosphoribulokinase/uridine kinase domain-containing protein n=1 Tax=Candidatus Vogelbacteria bacterium CG10_big_fil_rev_8_21_14_0_10_51_16 TaxID=1975045 RepID=A0A2H0RFK0_9BACT|nr:MAG: hypothetical protein COV10_00415 [Candidatus Vogelbacteria bacterium CG10_big_fil_rev_8_21_14_0_10_51_16]